MRITQAFTAYLAVIKGLIHRIDFFGVSTYLRKALGFHSGFLFESKGIRVQGSGGITF